MCGGGGGGGGGGNFRKGCQRVLEMFASYKRVQIQSSDQGSFWKTIKEIQNNTNQWIMCDSP